ncbi:MAG: hypothetical protein HQ521_03580 [Bacteroidetes bacterium]|nr:hypothetical protein [Bacteroidota bacterium]
MSGAYSGIKSGSVIDMGRTVDFKGLIVTDLVVSNYSSQPGDSGAPIRSYYTGLSGGLKLIGFHEGHNGTTGLSYFTKQEKYTTYFYNLTWDF